MPDEIENRVPVTTLAEGLLLIKFQRFSWPATLRGSFSSAIKGHSDPIVVKTEGEFVKILEDELRISPVGEVLVCWHWPS